MVLPGLIFSALSWSWLLASEAPNTGEPSGLLFAVAIVALFGLAIGLSFALRMLKNALRMDDA